MTEPDPKFADKFYKPGHVVRGRDINPLYRTLAALVNLQVTRTEGLPDAAGNYQRSGELKIAGINAILDLIDPPIAAEDSGGGGTANIVPMQVQSFTVGQDYLSAKFGAFVGTSFTATGAAINVALPWELRSGQQPGTNYSITPAFLEADIIFALSTSAGNNGVVVSSAELQWLDLGLGRVWQGVTLTYRGSYNTLLIYNPGDVVRVQSGGSQGVWICVKQTAVSSNVPTFPEPSTTGGTNYWELFTLGIQAESVCSISGSTQYFNATPPM